MFDLFRSREKTVRYVLGALLCIVALSMVVTLIPGFGGGLSSDNPNDRVMAQIGDETLTEMEVRGAIQRQMRDRQMPPQMAEFYVPVFVNQMVTDRALEYKARKLGFEVSEQELGTALRSILPMLFQDGKFAGTQAYAGVLAQQGMTITEFEANVKKQLLMNRLEALALEGIVVTPTDVEADFRKKNEKVKIQYVPLSIDNFKSQVQISPAELQESFEKNKAMYRVPEKRAYAIYLIDEAKVLTTITAPEEEIRRAYEARKDSYRTAERVHVRHILLKTTDKPADEVTKIEKRAQDLLKQIKGGADFAELARKNSEDPGSAVKGGDLDWIVKGQTVPEFEKSAFSLKPGEVSPLVKTMFGYHILKLDGREDARLKPFEEVRTELIREISSQQVDGKMRQIGDQLRAALAKSPADAEKFAQANGIQVIKVDKAADGEPLPQVGTNPEFREAVSKLTKGGISTVVPVAGGKMAVGQVLDIFPSHPAALSEVEAQVRAALANEKSGKMLTAKVEEAKAKFQSSTDLAKLAKGFNSSVKTPPEFSIDGAVEGLGTATQVEDAFRKNPGDTFGPVQAGGQFFFCKVVEKTPADLTKLATEREGIVQAIKQRRAKERRDLFADGVLKELIKDKKVKVNDDAVKRLAMSYRG